MKLFECQNCGSRFISRTRAARAAGWRSAIAGARDRERLKDDGGVWHALARASRANRYCANASTRLQLAGPRRPV